MHLGGWGGRRRSPHERVPRAAPAADTASASKAENHPGRGVGFFFFYFCTNKVQFLFLESVTEEQTARPKPAPWNVLSLSVPVRNDLEHQVSKTRHSETPSPKVTYVVTSTERKSLREFI